jgi:hypothetical protein
MEIYDIDNDLPESDKVSISINGTKYIVPLVISYGLGCYMLSHTEDLKEIFTTEGRPSLTRKTLDFAYNVTVELLKEQDPDTLSDEYLKKHLSVPRMIILLVKLAKPFITYMNQYGPALIGIVEPDGHAKTKKKV